LVDVAVDGIAHVVAAEFALESEYVCGGICEYNVVEVLDVQTYGTVSDEGIGTSGGNVDSLASVNCCGSLMLFVSIQVPMRAMALPSATPFPKVIEFLSEREDSGVVCSFG